VVQRRAAGREAATRLHDLDQERAAGQRFVAAGDDVAYGPAVRFHAEHLLGAGEDRLAGGKLDAPLAGVLRQLVSHVEGRRIGGYAHAGADAEGVDRRASRDDARDLVLVEPAAREDLDLAEPGAVQDLAGAE